MAAKAPSGAKPLLIAAALFVLAAVLLFVFYMRVSSTKLGDEVFHAGDAEELSTSIDTGGPLIFQDPIRQAKGRNIYVQHLGKNPNKGWHAFSANSPREKLCLITWSSARKLFVDRCSQETYPADGKGLTSYPVTVKDGDVSIDLRKPIKPKAPPKPTDSSSTTTVATTIK